MTFSGVPDGKSVVLITKLDNFNPICRVKAIKIFVRSAFAGVFAGLAVDDVL
mgnify:CR=1 FL=1